MFFDCRQITSLDLSRWNVSNVTVLSSGFGEMETNGRISSTSGCFEKCINLKTLNLSGWNTQKVTAMQNMFYGCNKLETIYASDTFVTNQATTYSQMFYNCTALRGGANTVYSSNHVDKTYAHIDGGTSNPGYFTRKP